VTHPLLDRRELLALPLLIAAALALGTLIPDRPLMALGVVAVGGALALAFMAPVVHLLLILVLTAIVPFHLQNRMGLGGGEGSPGLILTDVLILSGLLRAALVLSGRRLPRRTVVGIALLACLLLVAGMQILHGLVLDRDVSVVGAEFRAVLGFATLVVAIPILLDARYRGRLIYGLVVSGMALGAWGLAQWLLGIEFGGAGDVGVRAGVSYTTAGVGQIQGGLYAFPVASILALAALTSSAVRTSGARAALLAVAVLNFSCVLLTYERTFWLATAAGVTFVMLRAGLARWIRVAGWSLLALLLVASSVTAFAPGALKTGEERLLSVGNYQDDLSLEYRLTESRFVLAEIRERPLLGSGFGASIYWGRPAQDVPAAEATYSHAGYLVLAWKLGLVGAALLLTLMGIGILARGTPPGPPAMAALKTGAQGALVGLLIVGIAFPTFTTLSISATIGFLLAVCAVAGVHDQRGLAR
jgi:O-antigen ligase